MHCQQTAVQDKKHIFAFAIDGSNAAALGLAGDLRSCLRLRGDGVKDVNATDPPIPDEGTERADDSFYFRSSGMGAVQDQEPGLRVSVCFRAFISAASLNAA